MILPDGKHEGFPVDVELLASPDHLAAIRGAESLVIEGDHVLVRAGLRPGVSLDQQHQGPCPCRKPISSYVS
jgi:hypothetical protein